MTSGWMSVCFAQTSTVKGLHHFLHAVAGSTGAEGPSVHFSGESEAHSEHRQIPGTHRAPLQRLPPSDSPSQAVLATECFISPNGWATPASPRLFPLSVGEGERRPHGVVHLIHVPPKPLLARVSRAECHSWTLWLCCPRWDSSSILQWQSTPPRLVAANSQHFLWSTCPITCRSGSSCSPSKAVDGSFEGSPCLDHGRLDSGEVQCCWILGSSSNRCCFHWNERAVSMLWRNP